MRTIDAYPELMTRWALQLLALVFVRPGELMSARWEDVSFDDRRWINHPKKTKDIEEVIVPLSRQALEILAKVRNQSGHTPWIFPHRSDHAKHAGRGTPALALRRMGITDHVPHGFRAAARTILDERLGYRFDWIEIQLGHKLVNPNGAAYARGTHIDGRIAMMQAWADYLDKLKAEPITVRATV
ncbi:MAG: site-specific integrase [Candidatus Riflebacteria bacterium]|nr:site-specific integrase [Candidatus Riflebacteria bacterium]